MRSSAGWRGWVALAVGCACGPLRGEVVLDGTVGPHVVRSLPAPFQITADLGDQRGSNLFHSFSRFNLEALGSATFSGPGDVQNILARVTGGVASTIDGRLASTIPGANLFFINPAGIIFGSNASLDISGSFFATTADYIRLGTDGRFDATNPANSVLSVAAPSAFGFARPQPGSIQVNGGELRGAPGKALGLIGGDVLVDGASLQNAGGEIHLASARAGELGLATTGARTTIEPRAGAPLGRVEIRNASVGRSFDPANDALARRVVIRGGTLAVASSSILAHATQPGEGVQVRASGSLTAEGLTLYTTVTGDLRGADAVAITAADATLTAATFLISEAVEGGAEGNVHLAISGRLVMDGAVAVTSSSAVMPGGDVVVEAGQFALQNAATAMTSAVSGAKGGDVRLTVAGALSLASGATLGIPASGGERVEIAAGEVLIGGAGSAILANNASSGAGTGSIHLAVSGQLAITGGGTIAADTVESGGDGARIAIEAGRVFISGEGSGISAQSHNAIEGRGGDIRLTVSGRLEVLDGGTINTNTSGPGAGGSIDIAAGDVKIAGRGAGTFGTSTAPRGITAQNLSFGPDLQSGPSGDVRLRVDGTLEVTKGGELLASTKGSGRGGRIDIVAGKLRVVEGGQISAGTVGSGRGGDIGVAAHDVFISGLGSRLAAITDEAAPGQGGNIGIVADEVRVLAGGVVTAGTFGSGVGGNVAVRGEAMRVSGPGSQIAASTGAASTGTGGDIRLEGGTLTIAQKGAVSANALGTGDGGDVRIAVDRLELQSGGSISVAAAQANAGDIRIAAQERIELDRSSITAQAARNGGSIDLRARDLLFLTDSRITAAAGLNGGNIFIDPTFVVLDHSLISANAVLGRGGNVRIISDFFLAPPGSLVTATSERGIDGSVRIDALDTDVTSNLAELPASLVDAEALLRELCTMRIENFSSFVLEGRGGLPPLPGEALPSLQIVP